MIGASKSIWGFDPRNISGCIVWLDAADTSTLTLSGSNITGWRDKSIYGNNVNAISATPPTYNSADSSVNFVASSSTFLRGAISQTNINASVFLVASIASNPSPAFPRLSILSQSANANSQLIGQLLIVNANNPAVTTFLSTNTNPTGQGTNFQTYISNVTFNTRQLITNISRYVNSQFFTILTLLNGNTQTWSLRNSGTFTANTTHVGTYNKYTLGNYADASAATGDAYNGKMFEYLVFNNEVSVKERQQIEAYLGHKWGINTLLPTANPYYSIKPHLTTFRPFDISDCQLWFDGADYRTMFQDTAGTTPVTSSGQSVARWTDKMRTISISNTGIVGQTTLAPSSASGGGIFFNNTNSAINNSQQGLGSLLTGPNNQNAYLFRLPTKNATLITASYPLSNNALRQICAINSSPTGNAVPNISMGHEIGAGNGGTILCDWNGSAWSQIAQSTSGYNSNTILRIDSLIADSNPIWLTNGTSNTFTQTNTYTSANQNYPINAIYMGAYSSTVVGSRNFHGTIFEMILYSKVLTTSERQQVEGYLAHKWGMTASLPATNSYKTIPPGGIQPSLIKDLINTSTASRTDGYVVKYDSNGTPLWCREMGAQESEQVNSVSVDSSGNVVLVGFYNRNSQATISQMTIDVDDFRTVINLDNIGTTFGDGFIIKYNSDGRFLFARRIGGGSSDDVVTSVKTDSSGNIIVVGTYTNTLTMFNTDNTTTFTTLNIIGTVNFTDCFVLKYDSSGTPLWARRFGFGGSNTEFPASVSVDLSGNVFLTGWHTNGITIYAANNTTVFSTLANTGTAGSRDIFIAKYDSSGTALWLRRNGGITGNLFDEPTSLSTDSSGNVIIVGYYASAPLTIFNASNTAFTTLTNAGSAGIRDGFIVKYDSSGNPLWARRIGGTNIDFARSVTTDSSQNIIVVGEYSSTSLTIFNADNTSGFATLNQAGTPDSFIVKYNSSGTPLWVRRIGGTGTDQANSVSVDSSGNVFVIGIFSVTATIFAVNNTSTFTTLTSIGSSDCFIVKYDSSGTPLWAKRFGGAGGEQALSSHVDPSGNIIVAGQFTSLSISFY